MIPELLERLFPRGEPLVFESRVHGVLYATQWTVLRGEVAPDTFELQLLLELDLAAVGRSGPPLRQRCVLHTDGRLRPRRYTSESAGATLSLEFTPSDVHAALPDGERRSIGCRVPIDGVIEANVTGLHALVFAAFTAGRGEGCIFLVNSLAALPYRADPPEDVGSPWWRTSLGEELAVDDLGVPLALRYPALGVESRRVRPAPPLPAWGHEARPTGGGALTDVFALVLDPAAGAEPRALMVPTFAAGWSLPHRAQQGALLAPHDAGALGALFEDLLGEGPLTLECLRFRMNPTTEHTRAVYEMAPRASGWRPPPDGRWVSSAELDRLPLAEPEHREVVQARLAEAGGAQDTRRRAPWAERAWHEDAERWIAEQLGRPCRLRPVRSRSRGWLGRVETSDRSLYFKALPPSFRFEPALIACLAAWFPGHFPEVRAADPSRGWALMADFGGRPLAPDLADHCAALRRFAEVQRRVAPRLDPLTETGCPRRPLDALPEQVDALLHDPEVVGVHLTREQALALRAARPAMVSLVRRLGDLGLPTSIDHGDLAEHNVRLDRQGEPLFYDLTDASLTHPFYSLARWLYANERSARLPEAPLIDAYLEPWSDGWPGHTLVEAVALARRAWLLHGAIACHRTLLPLAHEGFDATGGLRRFLTDYLRRTNDGGDDVTT